MAQRTCCTFKCQRRPESEQRKVVWVRDGKPYCNICFLEYYERNEVGREKIVRLYDDEDLYEDRRPIRRVRTKTGASNGTSSVNTPATNAILA